MKTNKKICKFILVLINIIILLIADFIILGQGIVIAIYEELESQNSVINVENIGFDSYFLNDGKKTHYKEMLLDAEDSLILSVSVKDKGVLNNAKIKIENSNFEIIKDKVVNSYIKNINTDTNEIELNEIIYQNNVEIHIPIKFKKQENFSEDYFELENKIVLSGIYKDTEEQEVYGEVKTRISWRAEADISLTQKIEKYIDLGENGILLQQNVTSQIIDNKLPRENEILTIEVPTIEEQLPESVVVLANGEKLSEKSVTYAKENKNLEIKKESKGIWGQEENVYKIIYRYKSEAEFTDKTINLKTNLKTKLYAQDEIEKQLVEEIAISKVGNAVSIEKTATNQLYKGYMYANVDNTTIFEECNDIEISDISAIGSIEISKSKEQFVDAEENTFDISSKILYNSTIINKNEFISILGDKGEILIKDSENNTLNVITSSMETDENGNIVVTYNEEIDYIKIVSSKPVSEGKISIRNIRAIKGKTGYTKEQLRTFSKLLTSIIVRTNLSEECGQTEIILNDTKAEASIVINNSNLSTLQDNENVQLIVTLKSDSEKYDLYKNPSLEIIFPKELQVNIKNIQQLNNKEDLCIVRQNISINDKEEQVLSIQLEGEQKTFENSINEGIQISITADIVAEKTTPSKSDKIVMNYTNENKSGETYTTDINVNLNSKYGVLVLNELSGYNKNNDKIESFDDKLHEAILDVQTEEKIATQEIYIVNNYEVNISDIILIGLIPDNTGKLSCEEEIQSEFTIQLLSSIKVEGKDAKVYYSEDLETDKNSQSWSENIEDISKIRSFKIELEENTIAPQEMLKISYSLKIPEGLEQDQTSYISTNLNYNYLGSLIDAKSNIKLKVEDVNQKLQLSANEQTVEDLYINIVAQSGGEILDENQTVYEGQGIQYEIELTNNSENKYKNLCIEAKNSNAIYYDEVKKPADAQPDNSTEIVEVTYIEENEELESKIFNIEELLPGETKKLTYQISVNEVEGKDKVVDNVITISSDEFKEKELMGTTLKIEQGELKLTIRNLYEEEIEILTGSDLPVELEIKNTTEELLENLIVEFPIVKGLIFSTENIYIKESEICEFYEYKDGIAKFKISSLNKDESIKINISLTVDEMEYNTLEIDTTMRFYVNVNNNRYVSNDIYKTLQQHKTVLIAEQTSDVKENTKLEEGDEVTFTFNIENKGKINAGIDIEDNIPDGLRIKEAYFLIDDEKQEIELDDDSNCIEETIEIKAGEKISLVIYTYADIKYMEESEITNYAVLNGVEIDKIETNKITYYLELEDKDIDKEKEESHQYSISGTVWEDKNKNGMMDQAEEKISNIDILLLDANTGEFIKNDEGERIKVTTNQDGEYIFENLVSSNYIVIFKYDTSKYYVAEYQKQGISDSMNSDVISKETTLDGIKQQVAITGTIKLKEDIYNINAGFIQAEKFDLRLDKYISKLIVQNSSGTTVQSYNEAQLARTEIDAKKIANSTVIVEYTMKVTNEGEVSGYVNELIDYMPADLRFISDTNKEWYQGTDGNLHTTSMANEIINPGESKEISLTLVKTMTQNNTGISINTAEIAKAGNNFSLQDIDSTPGNKNTAEDDISVAETIISIRTGGVVTYVGLILSMIILIGIGIYFINKKVMLKNK